MIGKWLSGWFLSLKLFTIGSVLSVVIHSEHYTEFKQFCKQFDILSWICWKSLIQNLELYTTDSWVGLCFYNLCNFPKLFDLFFFMGSVQVARCCLEASVRLSLIIHKHSVLSVLLVPFYKTFDLFCGSFNILLQFLYCYVKAFTSTLYFFSSFFLIPSFKGLLLH